MATWVVSDRHSGADLIAVMPDGEKYVTVVLDGKRLQCSREEWVRFCQEFITPTQWPQENCNARPIA